MYPVGWLRTLRRAGRALTTRRHVRVVRRHAWFNVRNQIKTTACHVRRREWRHLKNEFNGYLAEPYHWPEDGSLRRCGSGWTPARARRSLRRNGYREPM